MFITCVNTDEMTVIKTVINYSLSKLIIKVYDCT